MKYFLILPLILCLNNLLFSQTNNLEDMLSQKQIITADMIKAAGLQSLSDIFYLADKWDFYTIDGYGKGVSANSLSSFQRQNFLIMLDGQLLDNNIFDVQNINQIPISIDQVDYIILINTPQIYNGEFTENGLIDIHTKVPTKGLSLDGYDGVGEQTGKAGPYAFTEFSTPHVDKIGYYVSGDISYSYNNFYFETLEKTEQNFATDAEIRNRVSYLSPDYNKAEMNSSFYKLNLNIFGGNQQIIAGQTNHDNYFFFQPYGDEIPVNQVFRHIGLNGTANTSCGIGLSYSAAYSTNELNYWENNQNLNFDWQMENISANLEGNYKNKYLYTALGAGYKKLIGRDTSADFDKQFELKKAYGVLDFKLSNDFIQSFNFYVINANSKTAIKGNVRNNWNINANSNLQTSYTFSERLLIEDANYWFWNQQGYKFNAPGFYAPQIIGNFNVGKQYTFDMDYCTNIDSSFKMEAGINYRQFINYYVEEQYYQFNNEESTFFAPDEIYTDEDLRVIGVQAGFEYKIISQLNQKIFYTYQKDIWGSRVFRDIWQELPVHKINYSVNYNPVRNFGIWVNLRYSSSTDWVDYKYSNIQSQGEYPDGVKPVFNVDLSLQKWLWNRRIWLNLLFRNIFNQSEKYIPIGVSQDLRFSISMQIFLDSVL